MDQKNDLVFVQTTLSQYQKMFLSIRLTTMYGGAKTVTNGN